MTNGSFGTKLAIKIKQSIVVKEIASESQNKEIIIMCGNVIMLLSISHSFGYQMKLGTNLGDFCNEMDQFEGYMDAKIFGNVAITQYRARLLALFLF